MKGASLLITQLLLLKTSSALSSQEALAQFDKKVLEARNRLNEQEQKNFDMFDILNDKLTDSSYIHSLVETQAKYDQSDENPDYYGLGEPKKPLPIVQAPKPNATASVVQANATLETETEQERRKHHHKKGKKSRVKGGMMIEGGHTRCAKEGETCQCQGLVTYLVDHNKWHQVQPEDNQGVPQFHQLVDGQIKCDNDAFGDPKPGAPKHCVCSNPPQLQKLGLGKAKVHEGEEIDCVGTVFYGHSPNGWFKDLFSPSHRRAYGMKRSYGKMKCGFEQFGDVAPGMGKACWCDKDADLEKYEVEEGNIVEKCADEGQACTCTTTVHYGDGKAKDFKEMSKKYFRSKDASPEDIKRGFVDCDNNNFGDVLPNNKKQCFCERPEKPENLKEKHLSKCASEGDNCECKGRVFYGREYDNKTIADRGAVAAVNTDYLTPSEMWKFPWAEREVFGQVACTSDIFGNVVKGNSSQCYCESEIEPPKVERCAGEGEECVCAGRVTYGLEQINRVSPAVFEQVIRKPHKIEPSHGSIMCNNEVFGDPTPGRRKQCFCETGVFAKHVLKCGDEGEDCTCKGNIFYGASVVDEKASDFYKMLTKNFNWKPSNGKEPVKCDNAQFGDPLPGEPKTCFCDDIGKMSHQQIRSNQELNRARAQAFMAQSRASELEKQAKEQEALIEKRRKKHLADMEAQQKKNKAALEAMMAADKEQAEKEKARSLAIEAQEKAKQKQLDKEMHDREKADLEARKLSEKQALEYSVAMKAAQDASELERMKLQLEAAKKKAEMDKQARAAAEAAAQFAKASELAEQQKIAAELRVQQQNAEIEMRAAALNQKKAAEAAAEKERLDILKQQEEEENQRAATEYARTQAEIQRGIQEALDEQMRLANEKAAADAAQALVEAEAQKKRDEEEAYLAKQEAEKQALIEAQMEEQAKQAQQAAAEEEARQKAAMIAQREEADRLQKQQELAQQALREAQAAEIAAARAEEQAQSQEEIRIAKEKADAIRAKVAAAQAERQRLDDEKRNLALAKQQEEMKAQAAKLAAENAEQALAVSKELAKKKKALAEKVKKQAEEDMKKAEEEAKAKQAEVEAEQKKNEEAAKKAKAEREAANKAEMEAAERQHKAELQAREEKDKIMAEKHKAAMLAKKAQFEKMFANLWGTTETHMSKVQFSVRGQADVESIIDAWLADTMAADVRIFNNVRRIFKNSTLLGHGIAHGVGMVEDPKSTLIDVVTSDDRVPELIETAIENRQNDIMYVMVTPYQSGSVEYFKWAKNQTLEADTANAWYKKDPFENSKPIATEDVKSMNDFQPIKQKPDTVNLQLGDELMLSIEDDVEVEFFQYEL